MDKTEHRIRHLELHRALDELMADFVIHTRKRLSKTNIMDLAKWSFDQTINPTPEKKCTL